MKPALQYMFIYDFYAREHHRLPGNLTHKRLFKKRRAVILSWWRRLPRARRDTLIAEAEQIVMSYNTNLRQAQHQVRQHIDGIQERIKRYQAERRYSTRKSV